jgi:hypothetical protein
VVAFVTVTNEKVMPVLDACRVAPHVNPLPDTVTDRFLAPSASRFGVRPVTVVEGCVTVSTTEVDV